MLEVTNETIRGLVQSWSKYLNVPDDQQPQPVVMSEWDVSKVTSFTYVFTGCDETLFTYPGNDIGGWKFGPGTNMNQMFWDCLYVPPSIARWDVSGVVNMARMFAMLHQGYPSTMNVPLGAWNVSNVKYMNFMFAGCVEFNQPLGSWNVSNVRSMASMFFGCAKFNQPLGNWNVSNVQNMAWMFFGCAKFNQPLGNWNVSNVQNMASMFSGCAKFNQPLGSWNVWQVSSMSRIFSGADSFNQSLATWNLSPWCDVSHMLASESFLNHLPVFREKDLTRDAGFIFADHAGQTLKRAPIYRLGRSGSTTVGDIVTAMLTILELEMVDTVADAPGTLAANPIYYATRIDVVRRRVLEMVGVF